MDVDIISFDRTQMQYELQNERNMDNHVGICNVELRTISLKLKEIERRLVWRGNLCLIENVEIGRDFRQIDFQTADSKQFSKIGQF